MVKRMRRRGRTTSARGRRRNRTGGRFGARSGVRRLAKRVAGLERTKEETHYRVYSDQSVTGSTAFAAGHNLRRNNPFVFHINGAERGVEVQKRLGDRTVWTKIRARITFYAGTGLADETWVKWRLVQVFRPDGSLPTAGQYFTTVFGDNEPATLGYLPNINNNDQLVRYKTLKQGTYIMRDLVSTQVQERVIDIDWYSKGIHTSHKLGNTGDITDIDKNAIFLIMWTNTTVSTNGLGLYGEMHAYFHG